LAVVLGEFVQLAWRRMASELQWFMIGRPSVQVRTVPPDRGDLLLRRCCGPMDRVNLEVKGIESLEFLRAIAQFSQFDFYLFPYLFPESAGSIPFLAPDRPNGQQSSRHKCPGPASDCVTCCAAG